MLMLGLFSRHFIRCIDWLTATAILPKIVLINKNGGWLYYSLLSPMDAAFSLGLTHAECRADDIRRAGAAQR